MRHYLTAAYLLTIFLCIYAPTVGQGFISDDYGWITASPASGDPVLPAFTHNVGFYRPLVTLSFALNYRISGLNARPYALTNLALLGACIGLLIWLAALNGLSLGFGLFAAGLWSFNFHGVNMSLLWLSGRTSLLLTVFALGAAIAFLKQRPFTTAALSLLAMLSKEEATMLPVLFSLWAFWEKSSIEGVWPRVQDAVRRTIGIWTVTAVYLALRFQSGAFWPTNAPWFYTFSTNPHVLMRNVREYADRACTLSVAAMIVIGLVARTTPLFHTEHRDALRRAIAWLLAGYAITVFLPVRSSLYALFPSVGSVLIAGVVTSAWWPRLETRQKRALVVGVLLFPLIFFPVYRLRTARWVSDARLSQSVLRQLAEVAADSDVETIVLRDDPSSRANLASAIGSALPNISGLIADRPLALRMERRLPGAPVRENPASKAPNSHEIVMSLDGQTGRLNVVRE